MHPDPLQTFIDKLGNLGPFFILIIILAAAAGVLMQATENAIRPVDPITSASRPERSIAR